MGAQNTGSWKSIGSRKFGAIVMALFFIFLVTGCKKKVAVSTPPPAPAPPVVTPSAPAAPSIATFEAEPSTIEKGGDSTLRWSVTGQTTRISIAPGLGDVDANGSRKVYPASNMTYTITATGPGGTDSRTASITVSTPAPPPPPAPKEPTRTLSDILASDVKDAYFDYDKSDIREDARANLTRDADVLKAVFSQFPTATVIIEGHADERGSAEYNLGLSDRRSTAAKEFLVQLGVPGDRLKTVAYGKEKPQCTESNETCWQQNRRAHFAPGQ